MPQQFHATTRFVVREDPARYDVPPAEAFTDPESVARYWRNFVQSDPTFEDNKESLIVIPVSTRLEPLGWTMVSLGTVDSTTAKPRDVFRPVILHGAPTFFLVHNHPSGCTEPSRADRDFTAKVRQGAEILSLKFGDHIIVSPRAGSEPYSFREHQTGYVEGGA